MDSEPMVWLFAQVAWTKHHMRWNNNDGNVAVAVNKMLTEKLGLKSVKSCLPGAIFALQTDGEFDNILFKHKSFKEFLCAKRWMFALKKWMNGSYDLYTDNDLYDAPLAHTSEQTTKFLFDLIQLHRKTESFSKHVAIGHLEKILDTLEMCAEKPEQPQKTILLTNPKNDISSRIRRVLFQVMCWLHPEGDNSNLYYKPNMDVFWALEFLGKFQNIRGLFLPQINLSNVDLNGANLNDAQLNDALLNGAELTAASLERVNLEHANLDSAKLNRANLKGAKLFGANLNDAQLIAANLKYANLNDALLIGANLNNALLIGANLNDAQLNDTLLNNTNLIATALNNTQLNNAQLNNAQLSGAQLVSAQLNGAQLQGAFLDSAILKGSLLEGANLAFADLNDANLKRANLIGANLIGANLIGAVLTNAELIDTQFQNTKYNRTQYIGFKPTQWPEDFDPEEHEGLVAIEDLEDNS